MVKEFYFADESSLNREKFILFIFKSLWKSIVLKRMIGQNRYLNCHSKIKCEDISDFKQGESYGLSKRRPSNDKPPLRRANHLGGRFLCRTPLPTRVDRVIKGMKNSLFIKMIQSLF